MMDRLIDQEEKFVTNMLQEWSYSEFFTLASGQSSKKYRVQQASSDWIMFLDADDYYNTKAVEYLVALKISMVSI